jgi:hypothetical protein
MRECGNIVIWRLELAIPVPGSISNTVVLTVSEQLRMNPASHSG